MYAKTFYVGDNVLALHLGLWQNARINAVNDEGFDVTLGSGERMTLHYHQLAEKKTPYKRERVKPARQYAHAYSDDYRE